MATKKSTAKKKVAKKKTVSVGRTVASYLAEAPKFRAKKLNMDSELRDQTLAPFFVSYMFVPGKKLQKLFSGKPDYTSDFSATFENVPLVTLETLFTQNFINPLTKKGNRTNKAFLEFVQAFPFVTVHGFAVAVQHEAMYDIIIEGIAIPTKVWKTLAERTQKKFLNEFNKFTKGAVEYGPGFGDNILWAWWD